MCPFRGHFAPRLFLIRFSFFDRNSGARIRMALKAPYSPVTVKRSNFAWVSKNNQIRNCWMKKVTDFHRGFQMIRFVPFVIKWLRIMILLWLFSKITTTRKSRPTAEILSSAQRSPRILTPISFTISQRCLSFTLNKLGTKTDEKIGEEFFEKFKISKRRVFNDFIEPHESVHLYCNKFLLKFY